MEQSEKEYDKLILSVTTDTGQSFWTVYTFWCMESLEEPFLSGIKKALSRETINTDPMYIYVDDYNTDPFKDALDSIIQSEIKYPVFDNSWVEYCEFAILQVRLVRRIH